MNNGITRREALARIGGFALGSALIPVMDRLGYADTKHPNIIVILSDDQGYGEGGCYGGKIPTPNIDLLAKQGVRLTNFYDSTPLCSPTRSSLMSGKYPQRTGVTQLVRPPDGNEYGLPFNALSLAECLKAAGYKTGMVGKWHLGFGSKLRPCARGFDEYFGTLCGATDYYKHTMASDASQKLMYKNDELFDEDGYLTDLFTREAVSFVNRHAGEKQPFFLYLPFNAVHVPNEAPEEWIKKCDGDVHGAMLACMDDGIGKVMKALKDKGVEDNTLVIFFSDNGSPTPGLNGGLRGKKNGLYEGGIRVPFIARWPGHFPAGKVIDETMISMDIYATVAAAAGAKAPKDIDGKDYTKVLAGKAKSQHDILFWRHNKTSVVRKGTWKMVHTDGQPAELYDLSTDRNETKDLSADKPDVLKDLLARHKEWLSKALSEGQAAQAAMKGK